MLDQSKTTPPPLPELSDDDKAAMHYGVPFFEAFGKPYLEVLLRCEVCRETNTYQMWEFAARMCPECGARKGAERV